MLNLREHRHVHFFAAAGVGMSAIAQACVARGLAVSGSDAVYTPGEGECANRYVQRLRQVGVEMFAEDDMSPIDRADLVIRSTAIRDDHPAWKRAKERSIKAVHRSEALAAIFNPYRGVALCGTHGKTTTTAMAGYVYEAGSLDPTALVGGWVAPWKSNVRLGGSAWVVAEADESDGSFLRLTPEIAVVTGVEADHLDYFGNLEAIQKHFQEFSRGLKPGGTLWVEQSVRALLQNTVSDACRLRVYGWQEASAEKEPLDLAIRDYRRENDQWCAELSTWDGREATLTLPISGRFNIENATAAVGCGLSAGIDLETAVRALDTYRGTGRRQEKIAEAGGVTIYDDYAHHATEINVTLEAIQERHGGARLVAVFQPHRYTRTRDHAEELARSFGHADLLVLTDIYAASEEPIEGVTGQSLAKRTAEHHPNVHFVGSLEAVQPWLLERLNPGDVLVTLGAGTITTLGPRVAAALAAPIGDNA